jgi:hypothetical protein
LGSFFITQVAKILASFFRCKIYVFISTKHGLGYIHNGWLLLWTVFLKITGVAQILGNFFFLL